MKLKKMVVLLFAIVLLFASFTQAAAIGYEDEWADMPVQSVSSYQYKPTRALQYMLANHSSSNIRSIINNNGGVDGVFGSGTKNAVKAFQSASNISSDGVVGEYTWLAFNDNLVASSTTSSTAYYYRMYQGLSVDVVKRSKTEVKWYYVPSNQIFYQE